MFFSVDDLQLLRDGVADLYAVLAFQKGADARPVVRSGLAFDRSGGRRRSIVGGEGFYGEVIEL